MNKIESNTFAAACYDTNSIEDLRATLAEGDSANDRDTWDITHQEWREQIKLAIAALEEKAAE